MRSLCALLLAAGLLALPAHANAPIKPWTGGATPGLALASLDGARVDLASLRGRVVLLNFWATWCEPCRDEMPSLEKLRARMKGRPFEVYAVNYGESDAKVSAFLSKVGISLPVLLDPYKRSAEAWKVRGLPMTFLVGADGQVRYWSYGESDWTEGEGLRLLERMLAEAPDARR